MFSLLILLFSHVSAVPLPGAHHGLAGDVPGAHHGLAGDVPGPYQGLGSRKLPGNPSCISFTLQPNLPPETVQLVTYGAPEFSTILAMSLAGYYLLSLAIKLNTKIHFKYPPPITHCKLFYMRERY